MQRDHSPGFNTTSTDSSSSNLYLNQSVQQHSVLSPPIPQIEYIQSYQNSSQALIPHQQQQQHLQHQNNQQNYSTNSNSSSNSAITSTYANDYNFTQQEQLYSVDSPQPLSPRKVINGNASSYNETTTTNTNSSSREFRQDGANLSNEWSGIGTNNSSNNGAEVEEIYDTRSRVPVKLDMTIDRFLNDNSIHFKSSASPTYELTQDWSQHVVDEIQDWMHVLSPDAIIIFSTPSIRDLTGWSAEEITNLPLSNFIHPEDIDSFNRDYQLSLREGRDLTLYYRLRMKDDHYRSFEFTGHPYYGEESGQRKCHCFFGISRPYNSEIASFDSYLELKSENSNLRQEIQSRYQEIQQIEERKVRRGGSYAAHVRPQKPYERRPQHSYETSGYNLMFKGDSSSSISLPNMERKKISRKIDTSGFVCTDCHVSESPEWRKGPTGPKSLCNACGLRYAKTQSQDTRRQQYNQDKKDLGNINRAISPTLASLTPSDI